MTAPGSGWVWLIVFWVSIASGAVVCLVWACCITAAEADQRAEDEQVRRSVEGHAEFRAALNPKRCRR